MTDQQIKTLAIKYRTAIEVAQSNGLFVHDIGFDDFPTGSCGDASYLLAEYLRREGVETIWYSDERGEWSHAWLVVKDRSLAKNAAKIGMSVATGTAPLALLNIGAQYAEGIFTDEQKRDEFISKAGALLKGSSSETSSYKEMAEFRANYKTFLKRHISRSW